MAGSTRLAKDSAPETGSHPALIAKSKIRIGPSAKFGKREAEEADNRKQAIVPAVAAAGGADSGGDGEDDRDEEARQREAQRVRIALRQKFGDRLVVADRAAEVAVEDAFPISDVLFAERGVEAEGVTRRGNVGRWGAFAEHLLDGVAGDEVD